MRFQVCVTKEFAAAHYLLDYPGDCANLHGHTWKVELLVSGTELNKTGMLADFRDIKKLLAEELHRFDHCLINEVTPFDIINPTAENIARYIYDKLHNKFDGCCLQMVKVWEGSTAWASYGEEND